MTNSPPSNQLNDPRRELSTVATRRLRTSEIAARLLVFTLICMILYWGKVVLVPLALSVLISFVFAPLVKRVQRLKIPRTGAVVLVMTFVSSLVIGLGWLVASQVSELATALPFHRDNIVHKVRDIRQMMRGGAIKEIQETITEVDQQVSEEEEAAAVDTVPVGPVLPPEPPKKPVEVKVVPEESPLGIDFANKIFPVINPLATAGLVLILTIFILIKREDLRDRLVSFAGPTQLLPTIRALNEAGTRISRFLLTQFLINAGYGVCVGLGLYLLTVPYAVVWGLLAGLLRYVPYIGPWISALTPLLVSMVTSSGWSEPLSVIGLFLALEVISNNVIEPLYYGKSVGISEVAVLISAVVWAWLWGPLGLVLATPLSVCMVVLGQHVSGLNFFTRLMVDDRVIDPSSQLYHRLVSRDEEGAFTFVSDYISEYGWHDTVNGLLMPTLSTANRDLSAGQLGDAEIAFVVAVIEDIIAQYRPSTPDGDPQFAHTVLVCPPHNLLEATAIELAEHTLEDDHKSCDIVNLDRNLLSAEVAERIARERPAAVVVAGLPPDELTYMRRWCRTIRRRCPQTYIIAAHWNREEAEAPRFAEFLREAGANAVVATPAELWRAISPRLSLVNADPQEQEQDSLTDRSGPSEGASALESTAAGSAS